MILWHRNKYDFDRRRYATVTKGGTLPDTGVTKNEVYALVDSATISAIVNADIDANAAIVDTKLAQITTASKVSGAALTSLANIPAGAGAIPAANLTAVSGSIVQVVNTQTGAVATGTTVMVFDDTIPQNTEGDEYMTLAVTPTSATNKLRIDVKVMGGNSNAGGQAVGLFQDTTANAIAAGVGNVPSVNQYVVIPLTHWMTAGTTTATTFKVRAGGGAGTFTFNGVVAGRIFGGVMASSITISEIKV